MTSRAVLRAAQELCDAAWLRDRFPRRVLEAPYELSVRSRESSSLGQASEEEFALLVSTSFQPLIRNVLPYPEPFNKAASAPGGIWFWETYRHALFGENVIVEMGGTGVSLTEDFHLSQARLRGEVCAEYVPSSARSRYLLAHSTAKLEVLYAVSLSVAMHVAKHPVLEHAQGPRAVVFCATHSQCVEFTTVLNLFCASLHLVVHNLFEAYPSLPEGKRADVVVGTPSLWESVSRVGGGSSAISLDTVSHRGGLEDLLLDMEEEEGKLPPSYSLSRRRPYGLTYVEQLVVFDIEQQVNMGFGAILQQILQTEDRYPSPHTTSARSRLKGGLPLSCQQYVVIGGDRWVADYVAVERLLRTVRGRGSLSMNIGTAEIGLLLPAAQPLEGSTLKRPRDTGEAADRIKTKCGRSEGGADDQNVISAKCTESSLDFSRHADFDGLFIRNALSHARLLTDFEALTDFIQRVTEVAEVFWLRFEGLSDTDCGAPNSVGESVVDSSDNISHTLNTSAVSVLHSIKIELALVCVEVPYLFQHEGEVSRTLDGTASYRAQELGIWVHSTPSGAATFNSRLVLLFKHLFDQLNGELFDGSVVQCVLAEDAPRLPYSLRQLHSHPFLDESFSYGGQLSRPTLLEIVRKCGEEAAMSTKMRADERSCLTSADKFGEATRDLLRRSVPATLFLLPLDGARRSVTLKSSLPPVPADVDTVLVLRHILLTKAQACSAGICVAACTPAGEDKPMTLHIVEECCQYGRVLSYHVHEDPLQRPEECTAPAENGYSTTESSTEEERDPLLRKSMFWDVHKAVVSVFVEFASVESALEAARQFAQRFAVQSAHANLPEGQCSYVRLFRNTTYYQGVQQDQACSEEEDRTIDRDNDDLDSFFGELLTQSLLAE